MHEKKNYYQRRRDGRKNNELKNLKIRFNVILSSLVSLFFENDTSKLLIGVFEFDNSSKIKVKSKKLSPEFRCQVLTFKIFEKWQSDSQMVVFINQIIEKTTGLILFNDQDYRIVVRILEYNSCILSQVTNALSLLFFDSTFSVKNLPVSCTAGILNFNLHVDLDEKEWLFLRGKFFLAFQKCCENKLVLIKSNDLYNCHSLENFICTIMNSCFQIHLLKYCTGRYLFAKFKYSYKTKKNYYRSLFLFMCKKSQ